MDALVDRKLIERLIRSALAEDCAGMDITTKSVVPAQAVFSGLLRAREELVVAGLDVAGTVFTLGSKEVSFEKFVRDGERVKAGADLARVKGPAQRILPRERVALNFLGRLSGVATATAAFVKEIAGTGASILDTRKTTPGLRVLEKYAVRVAGGSNHRMDLADMALIKDNHIESCALSPAETARLARSKLGPEVAIELEVDTVEAAHAALHSPIDILMLDNFTPDQVVEVVAERNRFSPPGHPLIEVSGGIRLDNVRQYALTGVERIAVGAVIHGARFADVALDGEMP